MFFHEENLYKSLILWVFMKICGKKAIHPPALWALRREPIFGQAATIMVAMASARKS